MYIFTNINENKNSKTVVITEQQRRLLSESQESKSQSEAIRLVMDRCNWDKERANEFVRETLRNDFHSLRNKRIAKFTLGVARMFCDGDFRDADTIVKMDKTLRLVGGVAHINEYTRNLERIERDAQGGEKLVKLSAAQLIESFQGAVQKMDEEENEKLATTDFTEEESDYEIVKITSFDQAHEYSDYTDWCITHYETYYRQYVGNDGTFYFCLRNGYEDEPRVATDGCPLDSYGLSMIAVCVDMDGKLKTCTCRWNHANGGNDNIMSRIQISEVTHTNFAETFVPDEDVERSLSYEEYIELVNNDALTVLSYKGKLCAELSQDKEPEVGEYALQDSDFASYYLYDDNDEMISSHTFRRNNAVVETNDAYTILKSTHDTFTIAYAHKGTSVRALDDIDSYYQNADKSSFVGIAELRVPVYSLYSTSALEVYELSFANKNIERVKWITATHVDMVDDKGDHFIFNSDGKTIMHHDAPANGEEWFEIEDDGCFHCISGKIIKADGTITNNVDYPFEIDKRLCANVCQVKNDIGDVTLYDSSANHLLSNEWYAEISETANPTWYAVKNKNNKCNLYNTVTRRYVTSSWGDNWGLDNGRKVCVISYGGNLAGERTVLFTFDGKPYFGNEVFATNLKTLPANKLSIFDTNTRTLRIYDCTNGKEVGQKLPTIKCINSTYSRGSKMGIALLEDGKYQFVNLETYEMVGDVFYTYECHFDGCVTISRGVGGQTVVNDRTGESILGRWYDRVKHMNDHDIMVKLNNKFNIVRIGQREPASKLWFDRVVWNSGEPYEVLIGATYYDFRPSTGELFDMNGKKVDISQF